MSARAFALWRELEAESGQNILNLIGEVGLFDPASAEPNLRRRASVAKQTNGHAPANAASANGSLKVGPPSLGEMARPA